MQASKIPLILIFILLAAVFCAAAGCVEPSVSDTRIQSLEQVLDNTSFAEFKDRYLGFADQKNEKTWWESLKNKVGASVLASGPDVDKIEETLTGEKAQLVEDAMEFIGIDKRLGVYSLKNYAFRNLENITQSCNVEEWTNYSLTHLPTPVYHSVTLTNWNSYLPLLKIVLNNLSISRI